MSKVNVHKLASEIAKLLENHDFVCAECEGKKFSETELVLLKHRVVEACNIKEEDFDKKGNKHEHVFARRMFVLIARETVAPMATLSQIGLLINRDHSTVIHAYQEAEFMRHNNNLFKSIHKQLMEKYYAA